MLSTSELPAWLRAAGVLGVPSMIALFLVWTLTTAFTGRLATLEQSMRAQTELLRQVLAASQARQLDADHVREHFDESLRSLTGILRSTCVNAASTDQARARCLAQ
jgi:hypothetical protein